MVGRLDAVGNRGVGVAVALVVFLDVAAGFEDLRIAHHAGAFEFGFFGEFLIGKDRVADEADAAAQRASGDFGDQVDRIAARFGEEAYIVDEAGFVESGDVLIEILGAVGGASFRAQLVAQHIFVDGFFAAVTDRDFGNCFAFEILRDGGLGEQHQGE